MAEKTNRDWRCPGMVKTRGLVGMIEEPLTMVKTAMCLSGWQKVDAGSGRDRPRRGWLSQALRRREPPSARVGELVGVPSFRAPPTTSRDFTIRDSRVWLRGTWPRSSLSNARRRNSNGCSGLNRLYISRSRFAVDLLSIGQQLDGPPRRAHRTPSFEPFVQVRGSNGARN